MELINKISAKTIIGDVKGAEWGPLFDLIGNATGVEAGESTHGAWEALVGEFLAITPDGKEFKAGKAFPPSTVMELVKPHLMGEEGAVQVAFRIGKKEDKTSPVGYTYSVESLIQPEKNDPLQALKEAVGAGNMKALPKAKK